MAPDPSPGQHEPGSAPEPRYAPLQHALHRAVSSAPWWRRLTPGGHGGVFPAMAALAALLLLSLVGIAAPWSSDSAPAGGSHPDGDGPALLHPSPTPADPRDLTSRSQPGEATEPGRTSDPDCDRPLSVLASPDIAGIVNELARPLATGTCPQVTVTAENPSVTLAGLARNDESPDVWIPASSLWLRRATSGSGNDLPTSGTSIARSPVVVAVPEPVHDAIDWGPANLPTWTLFHREVTSDDAVIERMSMPDPASSVGALSLVSLYDRMLTMSEGDEGAAFLRLIAFRDGLANTDAEVDGLFHRLASTPANRARADVGVFPATEQQLLAYNDRQPAVPVMAVGTYDAHIEADYPMAISESLGGRLAEIADDLRAELVAPAATARLVDVGFRPPAGAPTTPAALEDTSRFPDDYPDPVALPDAAGWGSLLDLWTWEG